ncbi:putative zinc-binding dehydrogenase family oxidoreductase [Ustulina deusta]|nr:putative zinc-binding dehydrogenase family oxidoreductase [Ustulina deusta]
MNYSECLEKSNQQLPKLHRAVVEDSQGQPTILRDVALPRLLPRTLLVKTKVVALNPSDFKKLRPDLSIGGIICGFVHGSNAADLGNSAFAGYVRINVIKASTLGASFATSWLVLWGHLGISASPSQPNSETLISKSGASVVTTCSPKNFALVKRYGAGTVFDYTVPETAKSIRDYTRNRLRYALDCIADADSATCCYAAIGRSGGGGGKSQTRNAIKSEFVMLGKEYGREPNRELCKAAALWFKQFQVLLDEGKIVAHPTESLGGGFQGIVEGFRG